MHMCEVFSFSIFHNQNYLCTASLRMLFALKSAVCGKDSLGGVIHKLQNINQADYMILHHYVCCAANVCNKFVMVFSQILIGLCACKLFFFWGGGRVCMEIDVGTENCARVDVLVMCQNALMILHHLMYSYTTIFSTTAVPACSRLEHLSFPDHQECWCY